MGVPQEVCEKLEASSEASSIALVVNVANYFDAIRGIVELFSKRHNLNVYYVSATIPSKNIIDIFEVLEIDLSTIYFVDCISHIMMGAAQQTDKILYVESPTMLENILLKLEYLSRKYGTSSIVLIDSLNSLAIHNNLRMLSEFFHVLVTNLRAKGSYVVIVSMKEQETEEIKGMLNLVCDEILVVE